MTRNFERNESSRIKSIVDENKKDVLIGTVRKVIERTKEESNIDYNFLAEVYIDDNEINSSEVFPITSSSTKSIEIPTVGDRVRIEEDSYGKMVVTDKLWTINQLPPVGRAGMWKREVESPETNSLGKNNLFLTGYTEYKDDVNQATQPSEGFEYKPTNNSDAKEFGDKYPEKSDAVSSVIQIASHERDKNGNPIDQDNTDLKVEVKDVKSSENEDSYVSVELNKSEESDSDVTWGMKFNIDKGTFSLVDPEGYGIEAKGDGIFDWYHSEINFKETSGGNLNI